MKFHALLFTSALAVFSAHVRAEGAAGLGDFGSNEPIERKDTPTRGVIKIEIEDREKILQQGPHWEQYNLPFKAKRWGKYTVRLNYTLKSASLGVQVKFGEVQLKRSIPRSPDNAKSIAMGEIYIPTAGDQFLAVFTPQDMSGGKFNLIGLELVPAPEGDEIKQGDDGTVTLLAKDATTWSENMRYEPKPEKNCLGFWTDAKDFAEWEMKVDKPGSYKVTLHAGSKPGGSKVNVEVGSQKLAFTTKDTGDIHKSEAQEIGVVKIDQPGVHRLALKPETKAGGAIMDVQKIVLTPAS